MLLHEVTTHLQSAKIICQIRPRPLASPLPGSELELQTGQQCISTDPSIQLFILSGLSFHWQYAGGFCCSQSKTVWKKHSLRRIFLTKFSIKQSRDGLQHLLTSRQLPQEHQAQRCFTSSTQLLVWVCLFGFFCEAYPYLV